MVRKGLFDWLTSVKLDDFRVLSGTSKDLSCMLVFEATQVQECNLCKQPRFDCDIYLSTNMADGKDGGKSLQELLSIFTILGEDEKVLFLQKCIRQCQVK